MNANEIEQYYEKGNRCIGAGHLRFILMLFICFWNYGFPEPTGFLSAISGFAIPAFFILSGYFVLVDDKEKRQEKMKRKIKRSALCFGAMFVLDVIVNIVVCYFSNISVTLSLRSIFNFIVMNMWPLPIGSNIWFMQALLYAYLILYAADRLNLLKYYKIVMLLTFLIMLLTGEFAGILHFDVLGYQFIPGNWLTRAIPYLLLGKLLREKSASLFNISALIYVVLLIAGAVLSIVELFFLGRMEWLVYQGHMLGYGVMAFAACSLAFTNPEAYSTLFSFFDSTLSGIIYFVIDPLFYLLAMVTGRFIPGIVVNFGGLIALAVSILLAILLKNTILAKVFFTTTDLSVIEDYE